MNQVWQGIATISTIISFLLSIYSLLPGKSKKAEIEQIKLLHAEIDQLKLLLRKGVIYHQTTAPPQKVPLSKLLLHEKIPEFVMPFFTSAHQNIQASFSPPNATKKMLLGAIIFS